MKSPAAILEVQAALHELGYLRSPPSGKWPDAPTIAAINFFARELDLTAAAVTDGADRYILRSALRTEFLVLPAMGARRVRKLDAKTPVTLVKSDAGWTLIAREGRPLGFVATKDLAPIQ